MLQHPELATAIATTKCQQILSADLSLLARNCPGLRNFNWFSYLECSRIRVERAVDALGKYFDLFTTPQILDFGAWLGNFSLALGMYGYRVTATEMWARYSPALDAQKRMLADARIDCIDMSMILGRPQGPRWNAVLLMSVIEHVSDSPRRILEIIHSAMTPGGLLILDTPNLAYLPNRRKLNRGQSPYVPIAEQFYTEAPFEGHVREYTAAELHWMLEKVGFEVLETDFFNYSPTPLSAIPLLDHLTLLFPPYRESPVVDRLRMAADKTLRELIFVVARKK